MIILLVVIPFAVETVLHEAILEAVLHDATLTVQVIAEWLVAIFLGGTLGLIEVALAADSWRATRTPAIRREERRL